MIDRSSLRRALAAALAAITLGSCALEIDERVFWVPRNVDELPDNEEAGVGLFMGRALVEPMDRDLTYRGYWTTKIELRQREEDFIPADVRHGALPFEGGELSLLRVDRRPAQADRPLIVHCYGIGANLYNNGVQHAVKLLPYGDVLQFDLPGHGGSDGDPSVADFEKAIDALSTYVETAAGERPLVLWGHSLGGYICAGLAARTENAGLVIESSGRDAVTVASAWLPVLVRPLIRLRASEAIAAYDLDGILAGYEKPILMLGGERDDIVPDRLVEAAARSLNEAGHDVTYRSFENADHSTIPFASGFDETVRAFLARL
jgi:pimeloyl-ACP methyl ester carboxylesterase